MDKLGKEAAIIVSSVIGCLTAFIGLGTAFGLDVSTEQQNAIIGTVLPTAGVIVLVGPLIRQFVFSKRTVDKVANDQYQAGIKNEPQPNVGPPPTGK